MAVIKPFRGIRPPQDLVGRVASRPYDVLNSDEARAEAAGNEMSLYHIIRPEIDFPVGTDEHEEKVYAKAAENFRLFREDVYRRLNTTGQTFSLEGALNDKYKLPPGAIYITDSEDRQLYLYFASEREPHLHLHLIEEHQPPFFLSFTHEGSHEPDFTVHIPSFLRSEEEEIRRFIDLYKPAGRTYKIEYYDYE